MSARKIFLVGGVGVALLALLALALLVWLERAGAPAAPAGPAPVPVGETAIAPVAAPAPPPSPDAPEPAVTPPRIGAKPRAAASVAWDQVPEAARLSDLGPRLAAPVNDGLRAARAKMESCFDEDTRLQAQRPAPAYDPEDPPRGPAVLVLRLESRAGAVDVVDTEVDAMGTSTRELVDCARHVLRGWPIPAPGAAPGTRWRLKYLLQ